MMKAATTELGEVVNLTSGFAFKSSKFGDQGDLPLIRIRDVARGSSDTYYTGEYDEQFVVNDGDMLISMDGEFRINTWSGGKALLNQRVCKINASSDSVDNRYLLHFLPRELKRIEDQTPFVTVKHLSAKSIRSIEMPLPPLEEQRRIAAILDKADAIRRKRQEALKLADEFLRSTFLEMFGDPVVNPKGWEKDELQNLTDIQVGNPFQSGQYTPNGVRLLRGANVLPGRLDWKDVCFWSDDDVDRFNNFSVETDDIIVAMDRPWISSGFKVARVDDADLPALLVQRVARIRSNSRAFADLCYAVLRHKGFESYCRPTETTVPHISPVELKKFPMIDPPKELVNEFGEQTRKLLLVKEHMAGEAAMIENLFESCSQRAFRGEL